MKRTKKAGEVKMVREKMKRGLSKKQKEDIYAKHVKLLSSVSSKLARKTRIEYEEAVSIANLAFCECLENFDEDLSKISTWIQNNIEFAIKNFFRKDRKRPECYGLTPEEKNSYFDTPEIRIAIKELPKELRTTFDNLLEGVMTPKSIIYNCYDQVTKHSSIQYLVKVKGYKFKNATIDMEELKERLL